MELIMKKIYLIFLCALAAAGCHKPEFIEPTADRQGLTSLTAFVADGEYADDQLVKLDIADDGQTRYVLPVPWYYPDASDEETTRYMAKVRLRAELAPNWTISPKITLIDLTKENEFTLTDPRGESHSIVITGQRVRSSACDIVNFKTVSPIVNGIIDKESKVILLPTTKDMSEVAAGVTLSPHATISPDPSQKYDYTDTVKFTVTADDGVSKSVYSVIADIPEKLPKGVNFGSVQLLFNINTTSVGLKPYDQNAIISLASIEDKVIVCESPAATSMSVIDIYTGAKESSYAPAGISCGAITNDEAGHLVMVNEAAGGEQVVIWKADSLDGSVDTVHTFTNGCSTPVGHRLKVIGDVTDNAVITLTAEGIPEVTSSSEFVMSVIMSGTPVLDTVVNLSLLGASWGAAPVNIATVVPASLNPIADGIFYDHYADGACVLHYIKGITDKSAGAYGDWSMNPNCLDTKSFNGTNFLALFSVPHVPEYDMGPRLYVWDISDPDITSPEPKAPDCQNEWIEGKQSGASGVASGDVVMAPSTDGYYLNVIYLDHNSQAFGVYTVDCIKR